MTVVVIFARSRTASPTGADRRAESVGSEPIAAEGERRHEREDDATLGRRGERLEGVVVADAGTPEALGLVAEPPGSGGTEIPAAERLVVAQQAVERFSVTLAEAEAELDRLRAEGVADTARLDARHALLQKRLAIAELAERAIRAEVASAGQRRE